MKVNWAPSARQDIFDIAEYVAERDPIAALGVIDRIETVAALLADFPMAGRGGREVDTREMVVTGLPYIVMYRQESGRIEILRVRHTSQWWPNRT
jgi:toxin ParE1/3/4